MRITIAQIISFLFHPILMLVFLPLLLVYKTTGNIVLAFAWTVYTMIFLIAISFFVVYGVHKKIFTDLDVSKRTQRPFLFSVGLIMAFVYLWGLSFLDAPKILSIVAIGFIVGIVLLFLMNMRLKVSFHLTTVSALLFTLAIVYQGYYFLTLLLIPLVAWSRLVVKRHTLPETIVGACFGILVSFGMYILFHNYVHM